MLAALAGPAFLLGAALAGPPSDVRPVSEAERAPGRAAFEPGPTASPLVSPASESRAREVAALPTASPSRGGTGTSTGLTVRIVAPDGPLTSDEPVRLAVRWSDGSGRYAGLSEDWGDGTAAASVETVTCEGGPGSHGGELATAHRFPAGRYRVRLTVTTSDCGGRTESRTAEVTVDVTEPAEEQPIAEDDPRTPDPSVSPSPETPAPSGLPLPLPAVERLINPGQNDHG